MLDLTCMSGVQLCILRFMASLMRRVGENLTFFEMMIRARAKREIVIGYKNFNMAKPEVNPKNKDERSLNVDDTAAFVVMALGLPA